MKIQLNTEGKLFLSKKLGVQLKEAYFRVRSTKKKHLRMEIVLKIVSEKNIEKIKRILDEYGIKYYQETRRSIIVQGNYNVIAFIEKMDIMQYISEEIKNIIIEKYTTKNLKYLKNKIDKSLLKLIDGLTNISLKTTGNGYPQIILTYGTRHQAFQALNFLKKGHEIYAKIQPGKRSRTILIYRIADVHYLTNHILDKDKLPENFRKVLERTKLSPYSQFVRCKTVVSSPGLWRMLGLILGDNHDKLNSFSNTNPALVKLFIKKAVEAFGENALCNMSLNVSRNKKENRKPLYCVLLKGNIGRCIRLLAENLEKNKSQYVYSIDEKCFWEFMTGLYEADGCVTIRYPNKSYMIPYPDITIRLSLKQRRLAEQIIRRLNKEGIKSSLKLHSNTWEIRMSSIASFKKFFTQVDPIIKNPARPESFAETKTKPENVDKIYQIYKKIFNYLILFHH